MFTLFSVDDHIVEPRHVWSERVPAKFKDRAPHVIEQDGAEMWVWDGGSEMTMDSMPSPASRVSSGGRSRPASRT
jgi:hypothetical protein